jgi:hypothetical protein
MKSSMPFRSIIAVVLLILLVPVLTACDDADVDFVVDLAFTWAEEKGLLTAEGGLNWISVAYYQGQLWGKGTTGDDMLDTALQVGPTIHNFKTADEKAQAGLERGDVGLIDQAITQRPGDWSYHDKKAAVLIAQGDMDSAWSAMDESEQLVSERIENGGDCKVIRLNMLRNREQALLAQLEANPENMGLLDALDQTQGEIYYLETDHAESPCR